MGSKRVRYVLFVWLMATMVGVGWYMNGCYARATAEVGYTGPKGATAPFEGNTTLKVYRSPFDTIIARVPLYNPTSKFQTAHVKCVFFIGDWADDSNPLSHKATVSPHSQRAVEIQWGGDFGLGMWGGSVGANCTTVWPDA